MTIVEPREISFWKVGAGLLPIVAAVGVPATLHPVQYDAVYASVVCSTIAFAITIYTIPRLGPSFVKVGLKGRDLLKESTDDVPECMGLVCACVYVCLLILFIPFPFSAAISTDALAAAVNPEYSAHRQNESQLAVYLAAVLSILIATLLGLLDDLFDIRWRHKLPIPFIASVPLLLVYYAEQGNTHVVMPKILSSFLGRVVDLGPLYYVYMALLSTFTTNSINILAGINGLEVSQTIVISASVILNDLLYLPWPFTLQLGKYQISGYYGAALAEERHLVSLYFMIPLFAVSLALAYHNWYPARAFPGDTFCYFSGMAFAVVAILGHFSKSLMLFFLPQIFNFVLSTPQLFWLIPCPRHRVPKLREDGKIEASVALIENPNAVTLAVVRLLSTVKLTKVSVDGEKKSMTCTNLTILNFLLNLTGPIKEDTLTKLVIIVQLAGSVVAFGIRYGLAGFFYEGDRR